MNSAKNLQTVGKNVARLREKMGYTQQMVANLLGVSREYVSMYERNERTVPLAHIEKLADLFGIEPIELLSENETDQMMTLAFAFRADEQEDETAQKEALESIANFKAVVKSYLKMQRIANK